MLYWKEKRGQMRMYKAVIFDDESNICELVRTLVDWEALGITLVGVAHTGLHALELLKEQRPEIVISDIRMPGYDGIALIQKAQEIGLDAKFIMISGYKQFDYARKGLQLGAVDYLLKPIGKEELEQALKRTVDQYLDAGNVEELNRELSQSRQALWNQFVKDVRENRVPAEAFAGKALRENYALVLEGWVCAASLHIDCEDSADEELFEHVQQKLAQRVEKELGKLCTELIVFIRDNEVLALCAARQDLTLTLHSLLENARSEAQPLPGACLTLGAARPGEGPVNALMLLREAQTAVGARLLPGSPGGGCLWYKPDMAPREEGPFVCPAPLAEAIQTLSAERMEAEMDAAFARLCAGAGFGPDSVRRFFARVTEALNNAIGLLDERYRLYLERPALLLAIDRAPTAQAQYRLGLNRIQTHLGQIFESIRREQNRPVRMTKEIVEQQYMEPISLIEIADRIRLNPDYLSGLFKKETGQNFKDYLTAYRVAKAKEFLREGNESVAQIAEMVGYKDTKYFSKLFAQMVGVNPSKYRKLH